MPLISKSGKLMSPMLIILQETSHEFGPIVKESLFTADNISVLPTTLGKMTKDTLNKWYADVFFPNCGRKALLFIDSWNGHKDKEIMNRVKPEEVELELLIIPPGVTSICQPLDVYGFRFLFSSNLLRTKIN